MNKNEDEIRTKRIKKVTLRNTLLAYLGYLIPISASYLGKFLNLTSSPYSYIHFIFFLVTVTCILFLIIAYYKKEMSFKFGQYFGLAQLVNWLFISMVWLVILRELRIIGLLNSLIPFMFFFTIGNLTTSIVIVTVFSASYLLAAYYSIHYLGQQGTIVREAFHTYTFYYSSLFLVFMSQNYKNQRKLIRKSKKDAEDALKQVESSNLHLRSTNENVKKLLDEISIVATRVANEAKVINDSSKTLENGAEDQALSINEIAAFMTKIDQQTSDNANHAVKANDLARQAKESSLHGVRQMNGVNDAIIDINDSSSAISKIIKTIDDIAFQTNLLALNAAVEAARAGKHGKGFGVVAQEVRSLAAKSADAASLTTELIEKSIQRVEVGTNTSKVAVKALDTIHDNIEAMTSLVEKITDSTREQTSSISQVNSSMGTILQVTEQTALNAKQTTLAAQTLNQTALKIRQIIQAFRESGEI